MASAHTGNNIKKSPTILGVTFLLLLLNFAYHYIVRQEFSIQSLNFASLIQLATIALEAIMLALVFFITRMWHPVRVTLCYLSLPYFLFFAGWLATPLAIIMCLLFAIALFTALKNNEKHLPPPAVCWQEITAFIGIVMWVNLSGIGGYGYQNSDHAMHNGRLKDLIDYPWPVTYSKDKNLMYYVGYYLPAAAIGKFLGLAAATHAIFIWATLGVTLVVRWFSQLVKLPLTFGLVALFVFFGSQDILGGLFALYKAAVGNDIVFTPDMLDAVIYGFLVNLNFWIPSPIFIGNLPSNTFQLFWAPHQIIAGWLIAALLFHSLKQKSNTSIIFNLALLCLWSPMIMLAFSPVVLAVSVLNAQASGLRTLLSRQNIFALLLLTPLFLLFYTGGSALNNPIHWIVHVLPDGDWWWLLAFYCFTWGLYIAVCIPYIRQTDPTLKAFTLALIGGLVLLTQVIYGAWSDILCRGAAPFSFCLLILITNAWKHYRQHHKKLLQCLLALCFLTGIFSAVVTIRGAIYEYGTLQPSMSGDKAPYAYEYLGADDSLFNRYLRRSTNP